MDRSASEDEFEAALVDALEELAHDDEQPVDGLMLEGLRQRMGLAEGPPRIDRFTVLEALGAGGMGVVHAAHDPRLDRRIALKLLRRSGAAGVEQGLREARALARLSHPNVVTVFEAGIHEGQVFVAMELVEGQTLREWLREPHSWRSVCEVMLAAGRGLAAAHAVGIVHRDFKPNNVLLGDRVRVADFGLAWSDARVATEGDADTDPLEDSAAPGSPSLRERRGPGTLAYMAPEQLRGEPIDACTDQFAWCLVLYEGLTGARPFPGETAELRLAAIERGAAPEGLARAPRWLRALVLRGLHPTPAQRHPDLDTVLAELERRLQPRNRVAWVVAGLAVLTAAGAVLLRPGAVDPIGEPTCADATQALDEVWNAERREAMATAFAATDEPYATHTLRFVQTSLDRYANHWTDARVDACRAELRGEPSSRMLQCLHSRSVELDALVDQLEHADVGLVRGAAQAVSRLLPVHHCDRPDLTVDLSLVDEPARGRLLRARDEVSRAWALEQLGRYAQGLERVESVMPELVELGHEATLSFGLLVRGRLELRSGELDRSSADLHQAILRGVAGQADDNVAIAAAALAELLGREEQLARAHETADLAAAMHRRLTGEITWPLLSNIVGSLLLHEHRDAEAAEEFAKGIAACAGKEDERWPDLLSMHGNRSMVMIRLGRLDEAAEDLRASLSLAERTIGRDHPQFALLMISQAALLSQQGDDAGALATQREALEIWRRAMPEPSPVTASMVYNMGEFLLELGRPREALAAMEEALALWLELLPAGHPRHALAYGGIGKTLLALGDPTRALESHERALALLREDVDARKPSAGEALLVAARAAIAAGDRERAEAWITAGLEIYARTPNPLMEGSLRFERARSLAAAGEASAAVEQARAALEQLHDLDPKLEDRARVWLAEHDG